MKKMKQTFAFLMTLVVLLTGFAIPTAAMPLENKEVHTVVTNPTDSGKHGWAYGAYFGDIHSLDYVEEEYQIEGTALGYHLTDERTADGKWTVEKKDADEELPYKTRILVRRPKDAKHFNGTVLVEWADMDKGYEMAYADTTGIYENGFAYVLVTAQSNGANSLAKWDKERYGELSIADNSLCYDIFTQAANAVSPDRTKDDSDPMGGLDVKKLIAVGGGEAGQYILAYANGVQPIENTFDAFLPFANGGMANGFDNVGDKIGTRVRDDLSVPVLTLNTQSEAISYSDYRQPDSYKFRSWEIAGASYAPYGQSSIIKKKTDRDGITDSDGTIAQYQSNKVDWLYTLDAGFVKVHEWLTDGTLPPQSSPIEIKEGDFQLDEYGNVLGGVRLPELEVPTAQYIAQPDVPVTGYTIDLSTDKLKELYPTHDDYVTKMTEVAKNTEESGFILPYRTKEYKKMAENASVPTQLEPDMSNPMMKYVVIAVAVVILVIVLMVLLIVKLRKRKKKKLKNIKEMEERKNEKE